MALTLAIGFLVDDAIVFLENTVRLMERRRSGAGGVAEQRQGNQLHDSVDDRLAGRRVPAAGVHGGLVGRIFREFAVTIVVAIFA